MEWEPAGIIQVNTDLVHSELCN